MDRSVDKETVAGELLQGLELVSQLGGMLSEPSGKIRRSGAVDAVVEEISGSFTRALHALYYKESCALGSLDQHGCESSHGLGEDRSGRESQPGSRRRASSLKSSDTCEDTCWERSPSLLGMSGMQVGAQRSLTGGYVGARTDDAFHLPPALPRVREYPISRKVLSRNPLEDRHLWKKYGQKKILGFKYPRSYFKCNQRKHQGCQATKQVQRTNDDDDKDGKPTFLMTYISQHTCSNIGKHNYDQNNADDASNQLLISFDSNSSQCHEELNNLSPSFFQSLSQNYNTEEIMGMMQEYSPTLEMGTSMLIREPATPSTTTASLRAVGSLPAAAGYGGDASLSTSDVQYLTP